MELVLQVPSCIYQQMNDFILRTAPGLLASVLPLVGPDS